MKPCIPSLDAQILGLCGRAGRKKWSALVDSRTFLPQTPEVTQHRQETMILIMNEGCRRIAAIVGENGTYAMQFARIASEAGVANAVFLDPALAFDWVRKDMSSRRANARRFRSQLSWALQKFLGAHLRRLRAKRTLGGLR